MTARRLLSTGSLVLTCLLVALPTAAQDRLLTPADFLGYELGDQFTPHHRVVAYVEHVAAQSATVELMSYGTTNEGRPLLVAVISSAENMARLETIRTNNLKKAGLMEGTSEGAAPAIVWLSYNVHGNESVSTEAAMATLYELADPNNARTQAWLANTVVLLDPCINPDGRDRYVHFYNRTVGRFPNVNPDAREHREPWPGGRTNHYYFDLNRDWAWATQVETQQRLPLYHQWMPHIHVDFHEQGVDQPYYFAPAAQPYHEAITVWQRELQMMIGRNHARYFDANGWLYFTRQVFDLFYPGYGDTWPMFNGAIGMTYEQGGSGRAGLGIITAEGDTLTLRDRIDHHHTTGLSTIETAANNHTRINTEFEQFFTESRTSPPGAYKTFIIKPNDNPGKLAALTAHLDQQGITYGYATRTQQARGVAYSGDTGTVSVSIEPGDLMVSTHQPKGTLANVLFEPEATLDDSLSYDITAWALPYVYGLDAYALPERLTPDTATFAEEAPAPRTVAKPVAYLAPWKSFEDLQFLATVLRAGIKLRFAEKPFTIDDKTFAAGTLILTRAGNEALGDRFDQIIQQAAAPLHQPLHPVETAMVTRGADFGSSDVPFLRKPRVAVVAGDATSAYALGEVWHFFDQQVGYPVTLVNSDDVGSINLFRYDVLILPNGSYGRVLTDQRLDDLKAWIRAGGRLIAMERAAAFLAGKEGFALKRKDTEDDNDDDEAAENALRPYGDRSRTAISSNVTGAIFRAQLDPTHPLAFGYGDTYYTLKRGSNTFAFLEDHWNVGVIRDDARMSGFAGAKTLDAMAQTLLFGVQPMGRGEVIYLLDNPLFRGFWYNGRLLFGNAVFLVGQRSPSTF